MLGSDLTKGLAVDCHNLVKILQQHRCEARRTWLGTPDRCSVCIVISLLQLVGTHEPMVQKPCCGMDIAVVFLEAGGQKTSFCHLPWTFLHRLLGFLYTAGSSVFISSQQPKIYIQLSWDPIGRIKHLLCLKDRACGDVHIFLSKCSRIKGKAVIRCSCPAPWINFSMESATP